MKTRKNSILYSLLVAITLYASAVSNAAITVTLSEINGGTDLQARVTGFVTTTSLTFEGFPEVTGLILTNHAIVDSTLNFFDNYTGLTNIQRTGDDISSWFAFGTASGAEIAFSIDLNNSELQTIDGYISGTVVDETIVFSGSTFAGSNIIAGQSNTISWNGGGAGNEMTFTAIPEPSVGLLSALALLFPLLRRTRKV